MNSEQNKAFVSNNLSHESILFSSHKWSTTATISTVSLSWYLVFWSWNSKCDFENTKMRNWNQRMCR